MFFFCDEVYCERWTVSSVDSVSFFFSFFLHLTPTGFGWSWVKRGGELPVGCIWLMSPIKPVEKLCVWSTRLVVVKSKQKVRQSVWIVMKVGYTLTSTQLFPQALLQLHGGPIALQITVMTKKKKCWRLLFKQEFWGKAGTTFLPPSCCKRRVWTGLCSAFLPLHRKRVKCWDSKH